MIDSCAGCHWLRQRFSHTATNGPSDSSRAFATRPPSSNERTTTFPDGRCSLTCVTELSRPALVRALICGSSDSLWPSRHRRITNRLRPFLNFLNHFQPISFWLHFMCGSFRHFVERVTVQ